MTAPTYSALVEVAAPLGFEPRLTASKAAVLPVRRPGIDLVSEGQLDFALIDGGGYSVGLAADMHSNFHAK